MVGRRNGLPPGAAMVLCRKSELGQGIETEVSKTGDTGLASAKREVIIGDIGFADDTALAGFIDETMVAEGILAQTMQD